MNFEKQYCWTNKFSKSQAISSLFIRLPHVTEYKTVLDCGFLAVDSGFALLYSCLCQ